MPDPDQVTRVQALLKASGARDLIELVDSWAPVIAASKERAAALAELRRLGPIPDFPISPAVSRVAAADKAWAVAVDTLMAKEGGE